MIGEYISYFDNFASLHTLIQHEDTAGKRGFYAIDFMELLGSFQNGIREKGIGLYLINYQSKFSQLNIEEAEGGFVVMMYYDRNKKGAMSEAYQFTERVTMQLIAQMQRDSNDMHPLWFDSVQHLDSFEKVAYKYSANANYVGWLVTFNFKRVHNMNDYADWQGIVYTDDTGAVGLDDNMALD